MCGAVGGLHSYQKYSDIARGRRNVVARFIIYEFII